MTKKSVATLLGEWKVAMAWQYFVVCLCDFIIFPAGNAVLLSAKHEWHPLTLQNGGVYHMAMGAILGIASWQGSQERITSIKSDTEKEIAAINTRKD